MYYLLMLHIMAGGYQTVNQLGEYQTREKCVRASAVLVEAVKENPRGGTNIQKFVCVEK